MKEAGLCYLMLPAWMKNIQSLKTAARQVFANVVILKGKFKNLHYSSMRVKFWKSPDVAIMVSLEKDLHRYLYFLQRLFHSLATEAAAFEGIRCKWGRNTCPGFTCRKQMALNPGSISWWSSGFYWQPIQKHKILPHHKLLGVVASAVNPWERIGLNTAFKC